MLRQVRLLNVLKGLSSVSVLCVVVQSLVLRSRHEVCNDVVVRRLFKPLEATKLCTFFLMSLVVKGKR